MTTGQIAALTAAIGQTLIIEVGGYSTPGTVVWGEFLRAILTDVAITSQARDRQVQLTARVAAVNETLQTRTLPALSQNISDSGRRQWRSTIIDHRLRPGDTVTDGVTSFVAYYVQYEITAHGSWMAVQEAG